MKTSNLLFLALCLGLFVSSAFAACAGGAPDSTVDDGEECDAGSGATGCTDECTVENNYYCIGSPSDCYDMFTVDSDALLTQLRHFTFSSSRTKIAPAFNISRLDAASAPLPTITVTTGANLFSELPTVDSVTGNINFALNPNQTAEHNVTTPTPITFKLDIQLDAGKKRGTPVIFTESFNATFCQTEVRGTDPHLNAYTQPNKKLICVRSELNSPIFYLKRVALRESNEFQPGDVFSTGYLDCNCNYHQTTQS